MKFIIITLSLIFQSSHGQDYDTAPPVVDHRECDFAFMEKITGAFFYRDLAIKEMNGDTLDQLIRFLDITDGLEIYSLGLRYPSERGTRKVNTFDIELFAFKQVRRDHSQYALTRSLPLEALSETIVSHLSVGTNSSIRRVTVSRSSGINVITTYDASQTVDEAVISNPYRVSYLILSKDGDYPVNLYFTDPVREGVRRSISGWHFGDINSASQEYKQNYITVIRGTAEIQKNQPIYMIQFEHPFYHGDYLMALFEDATYAIIKNRKFRPITVPSRKNLPRIRIFFRSNERNIRSVCFKETWSEVDCRIDPTR